ncbi:MAG: DUF4864 domain-containing protein [Methylobacterium mesophilicum]|nr:DUF4864 domain-containing protein [Methylobacterium mesophilicum]
MRKILAAMCFSVLFGSAVHAGEAEVKAAQGTIEQQFDAFRAGDGVRAFSFAAPTIQNIFRSPDVFMNMVTNGYAPIRNPKQFSFGAAEEAASGTIAQRVMVTGPDGKEYEALYQLQRQSDGVFRIIGVSLRAANTIGA